MEDDGGKPLHSRRKPTRPSILIKIQIGFILFSLGQIGLPSSDAILLGACELAYEEDVMCGVEERKMGIIDVSITHGLFNQDWKG